MSIVTSIQSKPGWSVVTGPSIGPAVPTITFTQQQPTPPPPPPPSGLLMNITGVIGKYADGVVRSPDMPIPAGTTGAVLKAIFSVNAESLTQTQAIEIGAKFTMADGTTLNGQLQYDYGKSATEMTLDLTSTSGSGWSPTALTIPKFAPDVTHTVIITYSIDTAAKKISVVSVSIDSKLYTTPPNMLGVPGKSLGWSKNAFQTNFQPNTNPKGGTWQWFLHDVSMQFL
jgi:hypothetical protein